MRTALLLLALLGQFGARAGFPPPARPADPLAQGAACCCCAAGTVCACGCEETSTPGDAGPAAGRRLCSCSADDAGVLEARAAVRVVRPASSESLWPSASSALANANNGSAWRTLLLREHGPPEAIGRLQSYQLLI
jgi:hypothetical protein